MLAQHVVNEADATQSYDVSYQIRATGGDAGTGYDAAGNVLEYTVTTAAVKTDYQITLDYLDGYKQNTVTARSTNTSSGKQTGGVTASSYDANGFLIRIGATVNGSDDVNNDRLFYNDASGHVLQKAQGPSNGLQVLHEIVVGGNLFGTYGTGVDPNNPVKQDGSPTGSPNYITGTNLDPAYEPVTNSYPAATTGQYPVQSGDTLQSIAQAAYGDSSLWYQIADANGLTGNQDLRVGQVLNIPTRVGALHNNASTYAPYDASRIEGATTPNLPAPGGKDCGLIGKIIVYVVAIVVAAVVAYYTENPGATEVTFEGLVAALGTGASVTGVAVGAAVGSFASQVVGNVIGEQDGFSWKAVALSALSAGVGEELGAGQWLGSSSPAANAAFGQAITNATTQGIAVSVGLQHDFSWHEVAAAAAGGAAGVEVGEAANSVLGDAFGNGAGTQFAARALSGFAAGAVATIARGGRVTSQQVASDAFGNALGAGFAGQSSPDQSDAESARLDGYENNAVQATGPDQSVAETLRLDTYESQLGQATAPNPMGNLGRPVNSAGDGFKAPSVLDSMRRLYALQTDKTDLTFNGAVDWQTEMAVYKPSIEGPNNIDWTKASDELIRVVQGVSLLAAGDSDPLSKQSTAQAILNKFTPFVYDSYSTGDAPSMSDRAAAANMRSVIQQVIQANGIYVVDPQEPGSTAEFVAKVYSSALMDQYNTGVPAAITTAQASLESGFGRAVPADINNGTYSYNLFGVKGSGDAGSVLINTHEYIGGERVLVQDNFAAYAGFQESIADHSDFLSRNPRYDSLFSTTDVKTWANGLQSNGYATDPAYASKLLSIINTWHLR